MAKVASTAGETVAEGASMTNKAVAKVASTADETVAKVASTTTKEHALPTHPPRRTRTSRSCRMGARTKKKHDVRQAHLITAARMHAAAPMRGNAPVGTLAERLSPVVGPQRQRPRRRHRSRRDLDRALDRQLARCVGRAFFSGLVPQTPGTP